MSPPSSNPKANPPAGNPARTTTNTHDGGSNEPTITSADVDMAMTTGDTGENAQQGNEIGRLYEENARLRAELSRVQQALKLSREEAHTTREFFNTAKKTMEDQHADAKELREDASTYWRAARRAEDSLKQEREQWHHDRNDYIAQIDELRMELHEARMRELSTLSSSVPPLPSSVPHAGPVYEDDDDNIYNDLPMDTAATPLGAENIPPALPATIPPNPPAPSARTHAPSGANPSAPAPPATAPYQGPHTYSGVTQDLPANQRGNAIYPGHSKSVVTYRPILDVAPVPSGQPDLWGDYKFAPPDSLKRRHVGESHSGERHTPRGGTGFGFSRGRGCGGNHHYRSKSGKKADQSSFEDGSLEQGMQWVTNTTDPEGAGMWNAQDAQDIHSVFNGPSITQVDPTLFHLQQGLLRQARLLPHDVRSAAHWDIIRQGTLLERNFNHPIQGTEHVSPGVRVGEHGTLSSVDMAVTRFTQALRPTGQGRSTVAQRVEQVMIDIFPRPGTYQRGVARIDAHALNDIFSDPLNVTVITDPTRIGPSYFPTTESVTPLRVIQWLWNNIRLPWSIARVILEPFYQRRSPGVPEDVVMFAQTATTPGQLPPARRNFIFIVPQSFAIRDLERITWSNPGQTLWRWIIPASTDPSLTARTQSEVLRADSSHENIGSINVTWMPDNVRALFVPRFSAAVTVWDQADVLGDADVPAPISAPSIVPSSNTTDENMDSAT
ncbi:hypothetical protein FS749_000529 [Ceratobasidium sp. UAMH 11750]|nr:hypothetical protein FS749_000529 [Ceratobasidium sp. UAMH 11750]